MTVIDVARVFAGVLSSLAFVACAESPQVPARPPRSASSAPSAQHAAEPARAHPPNPTRDMPDVPAWVRVALTDVELPTAAHAIEPEAGEHVVVTRSRVWVAGVEVASVDEIAARDRVARVDGLYDVLRRTRESEKTRHPGEPFSGVVSYWIDRRVPALVVKSVFQSAAFAGYPNGRFVVWREGTGGAGMRKRLGQVRADALVPGPPPSTGGEGGEVSPVNVSGRLPPEVIQRIIRANYAAPRACYVAALEKKPKLNGLVTIRFVIGEDGAVREAKSAGSTLPDASVVRCVEKFFAKLRFPAPESGIVTVSYPIRFSPE
ncbi:MAG: AgmX/PglI C-terminal domain-containing protein [Polyangiaceae bacterium]